MPPVFVITNYSRFNASFKRYLEYTRGITASVLPSSLLCSLDRVDKSEYVAQTFGQISAWIEEEANDPRCLLGTIGIVDLYDPNLTSIVNRYDPQHAGTSALNVLSSHLDLGAVVAMLVLAYPEIHWIFHSPYVDPVGKAAGYGESFLAAVHLLPAQGTKKPAVGGEVSRLDTMLRWSNGGYVPLFDPTGLRYLVRRNVPSDACPHLPLRKQAAAAIDDESAYTFLNAYTAYRFGFRVHAVTSWSMMAKLFTPAEPAAGTCATDFGRITLTMEDIYLSYPDFPFNLDAPDDAGETLHLSNLEQREGVLKRLQTVTHRIFITSGHEHVRSVPNRWEKTAGYLRKLRSQGKSARLLYKPYAGIFALWEVSGLKHRLKEGVAPGFIWPPKATSEQAGGHSTPGRLLAIADCLINRAQRLLAESPTVPEAVHGAVLALEAMEYLGNKNPTTSLAALALKHKFEVTAECTFYGVEHNMNIRARLNEISRDLRSIGRWFRRRTRSASEMNAQVRILSELVLRFRNNNQFDEELECLNRIRSLRTSVWAQRRPLDAFLFLLPRRYIEYLLGRLDRFAIALVVWLLGLGLLNYQLNKEAEHEHLLAIVHAATCFFGMQPSASWAALKDHPSLALLTLGSILVGFLHLGIFVSHLYARISRR